MRRRVNSKQSRWIRAWRRLAPLALAASVAVAGPGQLSDEPVDDRDVVVILLNGQRIRGRLVEEDARRVVLRVGRVDTTITRDQIERVVPQRPSREIYLEMREMIDSQDVDKLMMLVEWLRDRGLLRDAKIEIDHILTIEPDNPEALALRRLIERQIELREEARPEGAGGGDEATAPSQGPHVRRKGPRAFDNEEFPLLTEKQANLIKVYEVDLDERPRLVIERETIDRFLEDYAGKPRIPTTRSGRAAFHRLSEVEKLEEMFRQRAREYYGEVEVLGLPRSLRRFRDHVHRTWLINSCATTRCHGGSEAGALALFPRRPTAERSLLTNLVILDKHALGGVTPIIDYANPQNSPLLHMALPREDSLFPHPEAPGWAAVFRGADDRRFQQAVEWIRSMHRPRPRAVSDYEAPVFATPKATSEPAPGEPGEDR